VPQKRQFRVYPLSFDYPEKRTRVIFFQPSFILRWSKQTRHIVLYGIHTIIIYYIRLLILVHNSLQPDGIDIDHNNDNEPDIDLRQIRLYRLKHRTDPR